MNKLMAILTPLALTLSLASPVSATCDLARLKVVRSEGPLAGGVYLYDFAPATVQPTFYYRFSTANPVIIDRLNAAWVGNFTARVIGNAASCGTTGTIRNGGTITYLFLDSFF